MQCDSCQENVYRIRSVGPGMWLCHGCMGKRTDPKMVYGKVVERIKLGDLKVSRAQLGELERRVKLPYKKEGGGYYLGRRMENGTVSEKWPDYA